MYDSPDSAPREKAAEMLLTALPDAVVFTDSDRVIQKVNQAFTEIFGYTADEIAGKSTRDLYADPDRYIEQGRVRYNPANRQAPAPYDMTYRRKDGSVFNAMSLGTPVRESGGRVSGYMVVLRDVTDKQQIQSDYIRLATAVAQATENVVITDPDGRIQYVNPSFEKTTGFTRSEVIGKSPSLLKSGYHDDAFYRDIWTTITSGRPWAGRIRNKRKDGSFYTEDCIISPVFSETGGIINFVGVKHDITRTLELEEKNRQTQRIESLGRLAGGVAHDINNMLFPILGFTEILLEEMPADSLHRDPIEQIRAAGVKIRNLIRQLLAFSRKQTLETGPLDLNHVIREFEKLLRKTVREDVEMQIRLHPGLPLVTADEGQMEQILMNLVVNAQNAMPHGGNIAIETGTMADAAFIRVSDTGTGMDARTRSRIFEPFFTTRGDAMGTGLGLATVYGIVKQHQGDISVNSEPGKGARFTVSLPVCKEDDQIPEKPAPETLACPRLLRQDRTALLAEDDPMALKLAQSALTRLGYDVVMAGDALACREFLSDYTGPLDLLLSDVIMPKLNGRQLHQEVVRRFPAVKTLFMSGYSHDVIARHGHLEKGLHFIAKPFSRRQLSDKLARLFNENRCGLDCPLNPDRPVCL